VQNVFVMTTLQFSQMTTVNGGSVSPQCAVGVSSAVILGTIGIIGAAAGPVGWVFVAIGSQLISTGIAAWSCVAVEQQE